MLFPKYIQFSDANKLVSIYLVFEYCFQEFWYFSIVFLIIDIMLSMPIKIRGTIFVPLIF
jgi:hypothetical protein